MINANFNENKVFLYGKFNYKKAEQTAFKCEFFKIDNDEDEIVSTKIKSCYNCLFRRWNKESFECLKLR